MLAPRWRVVVALFTVTSCIATAVSTFGVFLPVLSDAFGWSRGAVSVVLSISLVLGGIAAFPVGRIADRRGPRAVLAGTVAIGAVGFVLSARIDALWHLYLSYGVLVGVGGVPASLLVRYPRAAEPRRVVDASPRAARRSAFGDARLWFFVSAWCFLGLVFMMVTVHSVSYARDRGLPLEQASLALSAFGVGAVSGRLLAGAAADRFG